MPWTKRKSGMPRTIPLIRAANVLPIVRFMEANRLDVQKYMDAADFTYWYRLHPLSPVPTLSAIRLLRDLARDHGPDVGARIVSQGTFAELAFIGSVALGCRTPADALQRISAALPLHSSHEKIQLTQEPGSVVLEQSFQFPLDAESQHAIQVLFFSLTQQLCRFTAMRPPFFSRIAAVPHPQTGLNTLAALFDADVVACKTPAGRLWIREDVAANPFRVVARDRSRTVDVSKILPLVEDRTLAGSVRPVIDAMLHDAAPTIARVAQAGGLTVRTMQRRLSQEGTSFSDQLDIVRRRLAVEVIGKEGASLSDITERLGYSSAPSLVRAVRRLTGTTPARLKSSGS